MSDFRKLALMASAAMALSHPPVFTVPEWQIVQASHPKGPINPKKLKRRKKTKAARRQRRVK